MRPQTTRLLRDEAGSALVEFALMLPVVMIVIVGTVNYTLRIQQAMQVAEAASAGASFGIIPGNQANVAGMQTAAASAAPGMHGMTVTARQVWTCTPGGSAVSSAATCSNYGTPIQYVQVKASATVPALFAWPGLSPAIVMQQTTTYRVPWMP